MTNTDLGGPLSEDERRKIAQWASELHRNRDGRLTPKFLDQVGPVPGGTDAANSYARELISGYERTANIKLSHRVRGAAREVDYWDSVMRLFGWASGY
jgi:hypothetical protein